MIRRRTDFLKFIQIIRLIAKCTNGNNVLVLEIFYELKICWLDAAKQPVASIARYCSTLGYKLWHVNIGKI